MPTWALRLRVGRATRDWTQDDLAEACAQQDEDSQATWRQLIWLIERDRALPGPRQAAILEKVLADEPTSECA